MGRWRAGGRVQGPRSDSEQMRRSPPTPLLPTPAMELGIFAPAKCSPVMLAPRRSLGAGARPQNSAPRAAATVPCPEGVRRCASAPEPDQSRPDPTVVPEGLTLGELYLSSRRRRGRRRRLPAGSRRDDPNRPLPADLRPTNKVASWIAVSTHPEVGVIRPGTTRDMAPASCQPLPAAVVTPPIPAPPSGCPGRPAA